MDGNVGSAVEQAAVELLGPQRLAPDLGKRTVLNHVAAGGDGDDLDRLLVPTMGEPQRGRNQPRLRQREGRAAGAKTEGAAERQGHARLVLAARPVAGKGMTLSLGLESSCDESAAALV